MLYRTRLSQMRQNGARVTRLIESLITRSPTRLMERTGVSRLLYSMG
jgi:hypothetical protein